MFQNKVREELVLFWESELDSDSCSSAYDYETPTGMSIPRNSNPGIIKAPNKPKKKQPKQNPSKIFDYGDREKSKTESILAAHASKVTMRAEMEELTRQFDSWERETTEPEKRLDFNATGKQPIIVEDIDENDLKNESQEK